MPGLKLATGILRNFKGLDARICCQAYTTFSKDWVTSFELGAFAKTRRNTCVGKLSDTSVNGTV